MTATRNTHTAAARLSQEESMARKGLAQLGHALAAFRQAGSQFATSVVPFLERAEQGAKGALYTLQQELAKAKAEAEHPAPTPKAEQPKAVPAPAPAVTLPADWESLPMAKLGALFGTLGLVAPSGGLDRAGTVAAIRELVAKPVAKPETQTTAARTTKADKPAAKGDGLAKHRALVAECKAYGLNAKGKADELRARLAEAKANGATAAAPRIAKHDIPVVELLRQMTDKQLNALFRRLPAELKVEVLDLAR